MGIKISCKQLSWPKRSVSELLQKARLAQKKTVCVSQLLDFCDFCDFCLAEIIIKAKELQILRPSDVGWFFVDIPMMYPHVVEKTAKDLQFIFQVLGPHTRRPLLVEVLPQFQHTPRIPRESPDQLRVQQEADHLVGNYLRNHPWSQILAQGDGMFLQTCDSFHWPQITHK